jgi:cytochrome c biogenesis protein CcmG, thiol:disulfide interchange protein DsbE
VEPSRPDPSAPEPGDLSDVLPPSDVEDDGDLAGYGPAIHPSGLDGDSSVRRTYRRRWVLVAAVLVIVALVTSVLAFGLTRDPTELGSALVDRPAPAFDLELLDGTGTLSLADLKGQVAVVNFWASWCRPCVQEFPALRAAWDRYRDHGVVVVGVLFQDSVSNGRAFADQLGGQWPLLDDHDSRTALAYGVYGVPETFFVRADGTIAARHVGEVTYDELTEEITKILPGSE